MGREVRQIIQGDGIVSLRGHLAREIPQFVADRGPVVRACIEQDA